MYAVNDCVDGQHGFPILAQNIQTHIPIKVNVRMVHLGCAFHLKSSKLAPFHLKESHFILEKHFFDTSSNFEKKRDLTLSGQTLSASKEI